MLRVLSTGIIVILAFSSPVVGHAATISVNVPGTSNSYLAGMPDGTTARNNDVAPAQSPVLVGLALVPGTVVTFSATGGVWHDPICPPTCAPPDGAFLSGHLGGAEHGISDILAPINSLLGVFLNDSQPDLTPPPPGFDFSDPPTGIGRDFLTLSPQLKQLFFVGDGTTAAGVRQTFVVPPGATRLFLGTMDGFGWFNNSGAFSVTVSDAVIPEPSTYFLLGGGLLALLVRKFNLRNRNQEDKLISSGRGRAPRTRHSRFSQSRT